MTASGTREQTAVIVGAGMAGGNAAGTLREEGWLGRIVLLGAEPGVPFGRPPLSKAYLRGESDLRGWYVRPAEWYGAYGIDFRPESPVLYIDTTRKRLHLARGETLAYDTLILCTGGRNRRLNVPGADLSGIYQLRAIAESDAIRAAARSGSRAVVSGMGFIGAEVAASLRRMGVEVSAVFSGGAPLARVLGSDVSAVLADIHREHGVQLVADDRVVGFEGADQVERVLTAKGAGLDCDLVIAGIGIEPNDALAAGGGIAVQNGILVNERCQTSMLDVFAAGDVANTLHPIFGRVRVEHYNNAEYQGRAAARAALGSPQPYDYIYSFWSDQYDDKLEYVGYAPTWDRVVFRGHPDSRRFLAFYLWGGILRAVCGLNRGGDPELEPDSELRTCRELIRAAVSVSETVLADERVDLRSLLTGAS